MGDNKPAGDPFAIARHDADGDARVLALFHDWIEASREMDRVPDDDEAAASDAYDRRAEIEDEIIATPGGPVALAVKVHIHLRIDDCADWAPELAMLRRSGGISYLTMSLLRDAARLVPELAELAAPIIHEDAVLIDADIEVQWCRKFGKDAQAARRLPAALDRIARTPAKTDRGKAIKSKHAGIDDQQKAELLARAEAIAAEFDPATLPGGDAGLIKAERWLGELNARTDAFCEGLEITMELEDDVISVLRDRYSELYGFIYDTPPKGPGGAAAKLRVLMASGTMIEVDAGSPLRQVLAMLEREPRS
jgi:hypothetical protein